MVGVLVQSRSTDSFPIQLTLVITVAEVSVPPRPPMAPKGTNLPEGHENVISIPTNHMGKIPVADR